MNFNWGPKAQRRVGSSQTWLFASFTRKSSFALFCTPKANGQKRSLCKTSMRSGRSGRSRTTLTALSKSAFQSFIKRWLSLIWFWPCGSWCWATLSFRHLCASDLCRLALTYFMSTMCTLGALWRKEDLQGVFVKIGTFIKLNGCLVELLDRSSWENQSTQKEGSNYGCLYLL